MIEDNLDELEDYLDEFSSKILFDSETCPVCGINPSENIVVNKISLMELKFTDNIVTDKAIKKLEEKGIQYKQLPENRDKILIAEKNFEEVKSILK